MRITYFNSHKQPKGRVGIRTQTYSPGPGPGIFQLYHTVLNVIIPMKPPFIFPSMFFFKAFMWLTTSCPQNKYLLNQFTLLYLFHHYSNLGNYLLLWILPLGWGWAPCYRSALPVFFRENQALAWPIIEHLFSHWLFFFLISIAPLNAYISPCISFVPSNASSTWSNHSKT